MPEKPKKENESFYSDEEYMAKMFEKENRAQKKGEDEKEEKIVVRKKRGIGVWIVIGIVAAALCAFLFFALRKGERSGAGNFAMEAKITVVGSKTYYVEPTKGALCVMNGDRLSTASLASEKNVRFLTNIDDELYYLDADSYTFRKFTDGMNDKQVLQNTCYYPSYYKGYLYYIDAGDYLMYRAKKGTDRFEAPEPVLSGVRACFLCPYENKLFYVSYDDNLLYFYPIDGKNDPVPLTENTVDTYIGAANGWLYYTELKTDSADEMMKASLYRMATGNTQKKDLLYEGLCSYVNYYRGYVYFLQYKETGSGSPDAEYIYRIPAEGGEMEQVSVEAGYQIHLVGDYLYYVTASETGNSTWKRIVITKEASFPAVGEPVPSSSLVPGQKNGGDSSMSGYTFDDDGNLTEVEGADIRYEDDGSVSIGEDPGVEGNTEE